MIPARRAVHSLLAVKLTGIDRASQVMAEAMGKGLALFTGLNAIPKRTAFSEYSVLVDPTLAGPLMHRWQDEAAELSHVLAPGKSIDLNRHGAKIS